MPTKRTLTRQHTEDLSRIRRLVDERDEAREDTETERNNVRYLSKQLSAVRDELGELRDKQSAPDARLRDTRRALMLERRANHQLTARLETLQTANEALYRQLAGSTAAGVTR